MPHAAGHSQVGARTKHVSEFSGLIAYLPQIIAQMFVPVKNENFLDAELYWPNKYFS